MEPGAIIQIQYVTKRCLMLSRLLCAYYYYHSRAESIVYKKQRYSSLRHHPSHLAGGKKMRTARNNFVESKLYKSNVGGQPWVKKTTTYSVIIKFSGLKQVSGKHSAC